MSIELIGMNHRTAPVSVREQLTYDPDQTRDLLKRLQTHGGIDEAVLLSTCNRTELYFRSGASDSINPDNVKQLLQNQRDASVGNDDQDYWYHYSGLKTVRHCFRVAGSLDSMVIGESQILGQVKTAYKRAQNLDFCGKYLHQLFQDAFHVAKKIRTQTQINRLPSSVGSAAVALAKQIFGDLSARNVLVLGSGEMGQVCLEHLHEEGVDSIVIANRTLERAREMASRYGGSDCGLGEMDQYLGNSDIVLSSTGSTEPILTRSDLKPVLNDRGSQPLFFIDIAVPRDIDENVRSLDNTYLYNIDDLESVVEQNMSYRESELEKAERIIQENVDHFDDWLKTQDMGPMIQELKQDIYQLVESELREHLESKQSELKKRDLQLAAHRITNKLLDEPLNNMKDKAIQGDMDALEAVQDVFDLDEVLEPGA